MASKHLQPGATPTGSEEDTITPQDSASQCGSSTSVSSRAQRAGNRARLQVKLAATKVEEDLKRRRDDLDSESRVNKVQAELDEADAEDTAIIQAEAEEAGQAPPVTAPVSTATPSSLPPPAHVLPSSAAAVSVPHVTAGGAIPKRPPPGLPAPHTSIQDTNAPVLLTGAGSRDAGTSVMDTVLPGPALAGGLSVSMPAPGYHQGYHLGYHSGYTQVNSLRGAEVSGMDIQDSAYQPMYATVSAPPASISYFPEGSRYLPTVAPMDTSCSHAHPVATAREQPPGNSAPCTDTRSDSTGPCNNNQQ